MFKTTADPFVGRLTYLRVYSGTIHGQDHVWNANRGEDERIGQLLLLHGKDQEPVGELKAGEIGAVAKLAVTETGDTLTSREKPLVLPDIPFPEPTLSVAIEPQTKADLDKMGTALQRMLEEEPSARVERAPTGEQLLVALGEAHIAVIAERLKRKFGAAIVTRTPRVPYRETIRGKTQVEGKYKKQTGGHGMFGHVWLELEPNPGGGIEFTERVVGGSVPKGFFPGVEKGVREAAADGVLAGYPLIDFKATLYDGSFHTVDSNELSFKIAASMALKKGVMDCKPALLEPIMAVSVTRARGATWATSTATSTRAAAASSAWTRRQRDPGRLGPRPPGRAVQLRDGAALTDPRPRRVPRRGRPLRGSPLARRGEGDRAASQGARRRGALSLPARQPGGRAAQRRRQVAAVGSSRVSSRRRTSTARCAAAGRRARDRGSRAGSRARCHWHSRRPAASPRRPALPLAPP